MKKFFTVLMIAAAVAFAAGNANATISAGDVIVAMYDPGTSTEVVYDLGAATAASYSAAGTVIASGLSAVTLFGAGQTWSSVEMAYFGIDSTTKTSNYNLYIGGASGVVPTSEGGGIAGTETNLGYFFTYYNPPPGKATTGSGSTGNPFSYYTLFNDGGAGDFGGLLDQNIEVKDGQKVTIYNLNWATATSNAVTTTTGISALESNGTITVYGTGGAAAPIPPSVLLMGSGLLGLVGIGRRKLFS